VQVNPPDGKVKIGRANVPLMRWVDICQHWPELWPIRIISIIKNAADYEQAVHRSFEEFRAYGEWFNYTPRMEELASIGHAEALERWLKLVA